MKNISLESLWNDDEIYRGNSNLIRNLLLQIEKSYREDFNFLEKSEVTTFFKSRKENRNKGQLT